TPSPSGAALALFSGVGTRRASFSFRQGRSRLGEDAMPLRLSLSCLVLFAAVAAEARAEPITVLPDGNVVFNDVGITTEGVFRCPRAFSQCSGSGTNSVTLGTGSNRATITFT